MGIRATPADTRRFFRSTPPVATDDGAHGYRIGDEIIHSTLGHAWICVGNSTGAAQWRRMQRRKGPTSSAFGDSIANGTGASTTDLCFRRLVEIDNGWNMTNRSISGRQAADFADNVLGLSVSNDHVAIMLLGFNDMRAKGTDATALACYRRTVNAFLAWLSMPANRALKAQSASVTYSGTWSNSSVFGGGMVKYSSANGSTATFKLYGTVAYVCILQYSGSTRAFQISVDGVDKGTYHGSDFPATVNGRVYSPYLIRISGLTEAEHTVVLTVVNGTGNAYFCWAAAPGGKKTKSGPYVYLGNCLRMNATGYISGGADWDNGSDDAVRQYNEAMRTDVASLAGDGLPVTLVDACSYYNILTDLDTDNIHPNDTGHSHVADAFLGELR
ncbi:MAG: SGNH/GDSL hydrolase family protein [Nitrospirota bacterium]|nr:SGNH/GDSL hydrolase family protein [Nitrospirota bacterium]